MRVNPGRPGSRVFIPGPTNREVRMALIFFRFGQRIRAPRILPSETRASQDELRWNHTRSA